MPRRPSGPCPRSRRHLRPGCTTSTSSPWWEAASRPAARSASRSVRPMVAPAATSSTPRIPAPTPTAGSRSTSRRCPAAPPGCRSTAASRRAASCERPSSTVRWWCPCRSPSVRPTHRVAATWIRCSPTSRSTAMSSTATPSTPTAGPIQLKLDIFRPAGRHGDQSSCHGVDAWWVLHRRRQVEHVGRGLGGRRARLRRRLVAVPAAARRRWAGTTSTSPASTPTTTPWPASSGCSRTPRTTGSTPTPSPPGASLPVQ